MRPAKEPTQRECNSNGHVRSVFDRMTNDILERGRCLAHPSSGAGCDIFGLTVQILGRALGLFDDALDLRSRLIMIAVVLSDGGLGCLSQAVEHCQRP